MRGDISVEEESKIQKSAVNFWEVLKRFENWPHLNYQCFNNFFRSIVFLDRYKHTSGDAWYLGGCLWQPKLIETKLSWLTFYL